MRARVCVFLMLSGCGAGERLVEAAHEATTDAMNQERGERGEDGPGVGELFVGRRCEGDWVEECDENSCNMLLDCNDVHRTCREVDGTARCEGPLIGYHGREAQWSWRWAHYCTTPEECGLVPEPNPNPDEEVPFDDPGIGDPAEPTSPEGEPAPAAPPGSTDPSTPPSGESAGSSSDGGSSSSYSSSGSSASSGYSSSGGGSYGGSYGSGMGY